MMRILIADDHDVVRAGLRRIAGSATRIVKWSRKLFNGRDAIDKAIATKPDIAVLDYSLPLVNGVEVTRQIRARLPKNSGSSDFYHA